MTMMGWTTTKDMKPSENAIWLQEVGWVRGMKARDVKPGMYRFYNFGTACQVVKVEQKKNSVYITVTQNGVEYTRRSSAETFVPVQEATPRS